MAGRECEGIELAPMGRAHLARVARIDASASPHPWSTATLRTELDRADRRYLVADLTVPEGPPTLVGFGGVALLGDEAHVMTVAVDPAVQRRGVGSCLVAGLLEEAARVGIHAVTLEVREGNGAARRLYRRAGFVEAGVRPGYYPDGEDAVIMWWHEVSRR